MNSSVEAIEGSHVSLLCGADSNPPPLLTWMRDGMVLREAVAESLYLDLEEVTPGEDGVYACLAENAYGQDNRTVELNVMCESPRGVGGHPYTPAGNRHWERLHSEELLALNNRNLLAVCSGSLMGGLRLPQASISLIAWTWL